MARFIALSLLAASIPSPVLGSWWSGDKQQNAETSWWPSNSQKQEASAWQMSTTKTKHSDVWIVQGNAGAGAENQVWNDYAMEPGQVHEVIVGGDAGLVYVPDSVHAAVGDIIKFVFMAQNHTVTQSTFAEPCVAMEGGVDSGFIPNPNNTVNPPPTMEFQVMTEKPIWMYCAQGNHCGAGMVFSINPTEEKSHAAFLENALKNGDDAGGAAGGAGAGGLGDAAGNAAVSATGTCTTETMTAAAETQAAGWAQTTAAAWPAESSASTDSAWAQSSTSQAAPAAQTSGVVQGTGTWTSGGACDCSCLCGAGAFPDGAGIGAVGGMEGEIPWTR